MWQAVRRELSRLEWDVEPPLTLDLMADWTQTVSSLVDDPPSARPDLHSRPPRAAGHRNDRRSANC